MSALLYLTFSSQGYFFNGNYILTIISLAMFALGIMVAREGFLQLRKIRK